MEWFDAVLLARIQFAFTISFHIIFPAFTIGLASYLAVLEGLWLYTKRDVYLHIFKYWLKIFAVAFAMGVVSGVVMSYQFGTNWGPFAEKTAPSAWAPARLRGADGLLPRSRVPRRHAVRPEQGGPQAPFRCHRSGRRGDIDVGLLDLCRPTAGCRHPRPT